MNGKINEKGILEIQRGSKYKPQLCCKIGDCSCTDDCVLFEEPVIFGAKTTGVPVATLKICQGKEFTFEEFQDLRISKP
jgi:hypothetical protein